MSDYMREAIERAELTLNCVKRRHQAIMDAVRWHHFDANLSVSPESKGIERSVLKSLEACLTDDERYEMEEQGKIWCYHSECKTWADVMAKVEPDGYAPIIVDRQQTYNNDHCGCDSEREWGVPCARDGDGVFECHVISQPK